MTSSIVYMPIGQGGMNKDHGCADEIHEVGEATWSDRSGQPVRGLGQGWDALDLELEGRGEADYWTE